LEKFNLTENDFLFLDRMILGMGYHKITKNDSRKTFLRLNLSPPRPIVGRETSYYYNGRNGVYSVILHTSYLEAEKKWRNTGEDAGWNLIAEGDKPLYFAKPFKRTKGFIIRFLRYAWISKWKVDNRPLCLECHAYMDIQRKRGSRQYFWACHKKEKHTSLNPRFVLWDYGLPKKASEFVRIRRSYSSRYRSKNKKLGIVRRPAAVIRKIWHVGTPENLE
jgi:hypothetical protein